MHFSIPVVLAAAMAINAAQQDVINGKQVEDLYNQQISLLSAAGYTSIKSDSNAVKSSISYWLNHEPASVTVPAIIVSAAIAAESKWYKDFPPSMVKVIQTVIVAKTTFRPEDGVFMEETVLPAVPYMTSIPKSWNELPNDVKTRITQQASSYVSSMSSFGFTLAPPTGIQGAESGAVGHAVVPSTASMFAAVVAVAGVLGLAVGL